MIFFFASFSVLYQYIYIYFFIFWPCRVACGILVPRAGMEPGPSAVKVQSPNYCTTREFLLSVYFFFFLKIYLFIWLHQVLVAAGRLLSCGLRTLSCGMHVGSSSLTRARTRAPCIGSTESYPLRHQGSPSIGLFLFLFIF